MQNAIICSAKLELAEQGLPQVHVLFPDAKSKCHKSVSWLEPGNSVAWSTQFDLWGEQDQDAACHCSGWQNKLQSQSCIRIVFNKK